MDHRGIPGLHGPCRRWRLRPMHQPLQLCELSTPKPVHLRLLTLRQPPRSADHMGQTGLSLMHPLLVYPLAIADHNPGPAFDKSLKGRLVPACLHFIVHQGAAGFLGNRRVRRCDRVRDSIDDALNRATAHGQFQDGRAKLLHRRSTVSLPSRQLPDERRQPGPIAVAILLR